MGKLSGVDILQYIKLNYLSKNVIHRGKGKIIPFRGAHIELGENSKLIVFDGSLEVGLNKVRGSKAETLVRLRKNAVWNAKEYCGLSYGTTIEVNEEAELVSAYLTVNSNCVLVANKKITVGNDVMLGRNVIIYDSDFHSLNGKETLSEEVVIGDHVWIATNSMILKGVHIGNGSVVAAGTVVKEDVPERVVFGNEAKHRNVLEDAGWKR